jgi:hypothetical protein
LAFVYRLELSSIPGVAQAKIMRYHRFAYSMPLRGKEEPKPFKIRDGAAFGELTAPLAKLGYEYGEMLWNPPYRRRKSRKMGRDNYEFIKPRDVVVLTTRPPLNDHTHGDKKKMLRSCTHLEDQIFRACRKFFRVCARSHVEIKKKICGESEKGHLEFHMYKGARLKYFRRVDFHKLTRPPKGSHRAICFFLHVKKIPEYGCGLVVSFGMGGWETLIWNRLVRTRHPEWLKRPCFAMGEFDMNGLPERPATLKFVDKIKVDILLEHKIEG